MPNRHAGLFALPLGLLLWAAATEAQPRQQTQPPERCTPLRQELATGNADLLPLLDVVRASDRTDETPPIGGYVQLWVQAVNPASQSPRCYDDETRSWPSRLFIGRNLSRVLQAKATVVNPGVTGAFTLASSTRTSTRTDGEVWNTELSDRRILTPHFRVDSGTTIAIELTLSASSTISGDITRNILSVIEQGARLASPTSSLVTTLTSDRLQNAANFVDRSISNLFGQKLSERSQNDFRPDQWFADTDRGGVLARVSAVFPMGNDVWDAARNRPLGTWEIRVSQPIISVFSAQPYFPPGRENDRDETACPTLRGQELQACRAFVGLSPATVLNFRLTENLNLGDALRADETIAAELSRLQGSPSSAEVARRLCTLVASKAEALGLNRYDAAAAVWAFSQETQLEPAARASLMNATAPQGTTENVICRASRLWSRLKLP